MRAADLGLPSDDPGRRSARRRALVGAATTLVTICAVVAMALICALTATTTTASAATFTYDAPTIARGDVNAFVAAEPLTDQVSGGRDESASPLAQVQSASTTSSALSNATEAETGASSAANGARLNEQLRLTERYGAGGVEELPDGRMRFYGETTPAKTPGEMAGARLVREWDPATGAQRTWYETLDQQGNIRIVRPETGGPKVHYTFGSDGSYTGPR
jgi:hypothetical protein